MKGRTIALWGGGTAIAAAALIVAVPRIQAARSVQATASVSQAQVTTIRAVSSIESSGSIEPQQSASLFWKTTGTVATVAVKLGDHVKAGDTLMTLDPSSAPNAVIQAESDQLSAQKALDDLLHPSASTIANAQQALSKAQDALTTAQKNLRALQQPDTSYYLDQVAQKKRALLAAQQNTEITNIGNLAAAVTNANSDLTTKTNWYDDAKTAQAQCPGCTTVFVNSAGRRMALSDVELAYNNAVNAARVAQLNYEQALTNNQTSVKNAQDALDTANANLAALTRPDAAELRDRTAAVAVAEANLADAQASLDHLTNGARPDDIQAARLRLQAAQMTLDSMVLRAPFEGDVLAINLQPGDPASPSAAAVVLTNRSVLHVDVPVDETDIGQLSIGQPVTLTVEAYPGLSLAGQVASVDPFGQTVQGLVRYTARINLTHSDPRLLLNMTANAVIVTQVQAEALAVPLNAVQYDNQGEFVTLVQADGSRVRVNVVSGQTAGDQVVVSGNLKPGDTVEVLASKPATTVRGPFGG